MRIYDHILPVALFSLGLGLTTAHALDGTKSPDNIPGMPGVGVGVGPQSPPFSGGPANHSTSFGPMTGAGNIDAAVKAAEVAFHNGDVVAGWKLGHMFADGEGVGQDALRAFEYFRAIAENQRNVDATGLLAQVVANAHVELGRYYQTGIPNSGIKADPVRAHLNFYYAANNFGDPDAQYLLARTYLDGQGVAKDPRQGSRWLYQAATKGQYEAQAKFGILLFQGLGQAVPRDAAQGLMWLKVAVDASPKGAATGVQEIYGAAWEQATKDERASAAVLYEQWKRSKSAASVVHTRD
jgi:TPR repeat protein